MACLALFFVSSATWIYKEEIKIDAPANRLASHAHHGLSVWTHSLADGGSQLY